MISINKNITSLNVNLNASLNNKTDAEAATNVGKKVGGATKAAKEITASKAVLLAPMEDITNLAYREICRELGAEMVFTEFVNSDGLVRGCPRGRAKMEIIASERPVGIQIYGNNTSSMVRSASLAAENNPDVIDINAGCWVKKVSTRGAGAGLLKDPAFMQKMVGQVVRAVHLPVTVKTRIGWDEENINIVEVAKRLEDVGVAMLTVHTRTRCCGHTGAVQWNLINEVKRAVSIPIILNGGIMEAEDAITAFAQTNADGVMVARGAIGRPWIFNEIQQLLQHGRIVTPFLLPEKIELCLRHLHKAVELVGSRRGIPSFRKYYSGYLKGFAGASQLRQKLMRANEISLVEEMLRGFLNHGESNDEQENTAQKNNVQKSNANIANQSVKKNMPSLTNG